MGYHENITYPCGKPNLETMFMARYQLQGQVTRGAFGFEM
jgi:hypothetical protein